MKLGGGLACHTNIARAERDVLPSSEGCKADERARIQGCRIDARTSPRQRTSQVQEQPTDWSCKCSWQLPAPEVALNACASLLFLLTAKSARLACLLQISSHSTVSHGGFIQGHQVAMALLISLSALDVSWRDAPFQHPPCICPVKMRCNHERGGGGI